MQVSTTKTYTLTQTDLEVAIMNHLKACFPEFKLGANHKCEVKLDATMNRDGYASDFSATVVAEQEDKPIVELPTKMSGKVRMIGQSYMLVDGPPTATAYSQIPIIGMLKNSKPLHVTQMSRGEQSVFTTLVAKHEKACDVVDCHMVHFNGSNKEMFGAYIIEEPAMAHSGAGTV